VSPQPFVSTTPPVSAQALLAEWILWMRAGALSKRTIEGRTAVVRLLEARTGAPAHAATWQQVAAFFADLVDTASPGTRCTYYSHLKKWFWWLVTMEYRADDPIARLHPPRSPRRYPRPISQEQVRTVLGSGRFYGRTRTMILLAAYQGLRVHEIAKIRGEDFTRGELFVIGKGGREDTLPVHPLIEAERGRYPASSYWFPSPADRSQPVTANAVSRVVTDALRRAGVDATAHQLRHYFGTEAHRAAGGDLRVAQELLRHSSPATTALYTQVDPRRRREAIMGFPAL
jgi:integrase/recombinase XerD